MRETRIMELWKCQSIGLNPVASYIHVNQLIH